MNLHVEFSNNKRAWCYCIYHKDKERPNLSITLTDDYYGRYKCWACGAVGQLSTAQMKELNLSKKKRLKSMPTDWWRLCKEYQKNLKKYSLFEEGLSQQWGVDKNTLHEYGIGFDKEAYTAPMRSSYHSIIGIQRRFFDSSKCCVDGSQLGIFTPKYVNAEEVLFICEGLSDTVVVRDLFKSDYTIGAIGRPNCNYGKEIIREWIDYTWICEDDYDEDEYYYRFDDKQVIIISDNNEVGKKGALELQKEIQGNIDVVCKVFEVTKVKDIREYISKYGKEKVRDELKGYIND